MAPTKYILTKPWYLTAAEKDMYVGYANLSKKHIDVYTDVLDKFTVKDSAVEVVTSNVAFERDGMCCFRLGKIDVDMKLPL